MNAKWNVYLERNGDIIEYNVFNNVKFERELEDLAKKFTEYTDEFKEELKHSIRYCYWAKCEYEIVLTDVFATITKEEVQRLTNTDFKYRIYTNLETEKKIDVADQLFMNYDIFSKYVFDNLPRKKTRKKNDK